MIDAYETGRSERDAQLDVAVKAIEHTLAPGKRGREWLRRGPKVAQLLRSTNTRTARCGQNVIGGFVKKSFVKVMTVFLFLGVMLNASSGLGQSIVARHRGLRPGSPGLFQVPSPTRELTAVPPGSPQYTFTIIDFPVQLYTNGNGANSAGQIVGTYGPAVSQGGYCDGFLLTTRRHKKSISETFSTIDLPKVTNQSSNGINDQRPDRG
jgi:hypothetical protein